MRSQDQIELKKRAMLAALEKTLGVVSPAAKAAQISRETHYTWLKEDDDYKSKVKDVKNMALDFAESSLHRQIRDDNTSATIFYLKTQGKARGYVEKQEMELSGEVTGAPVITFGNTTKEEDDAEE